MNIKSTLLALVAVTGLSANAMAADNSYSAPAVQGYDVVTYQNAKRPVRGNGNYTANHDGAVYLFSSQANLDIFEANPDKYVPAYGGYCAFGVSVGKKFIGDPEVWRVVDGTTYLDLDTGIQDQWLKDVPGRIQSANAQWEKIEEIDPAEL